MFDASCGLFLSSIEEHAVTIESRKYPDAIFDVCQRFIQISRILLSRFIKVDIFLIYTIERYTVTTVVRQGECTHDKRIARRGLGDYPHR